jgi:hypothetical protein
MALTGQHLNRLIEIFYGLAIAEGLARVIPILLDKPFSFRTLGFAISALLIGLVDWLAYHLFISSAPYKGLTRLLFDLGFPIIVFLLFAAAGRPFIEAVFICVYFFLALVYYYLFRRRREIINFPGWVSPLLLFCLLINVTSLGIEIIWPGRLTYIAQWIPLSTACLAAIFVLRSVQVALREVNAGILSGQREYRATLEGKSSGGKLGRLDDLVTLTCGALVSLVFIARAWRQIVNRRRS